MIEYKSLVPPPALKDNGLEENERRIEPRKYQKKQSIAGRKRDTKGY